MGKSTFTFLTENWQALASGILTTLELTLGAWLLAFALGTVLAVLRATGARPAIWLVAAYVEIHRNIPFLVQILFWYFAVPVLLPEPIRNWINDQQSEFIFALISIGLAMAAYVSEDLRSGMRSIGKGQFEASRALGLSYIATMRRVIVPQALRNALPTLVSQTLLLFKNTSLAMAIGVAELTYRTREIESATFRTFEIFAASTLIYLLISLGIMWGGAILVRRYRIRTR